MITVIDVMHDENLEITNELSWSVGNRVREMWRDVHGTLPEKRLHEKTAGNGGSHCMAYYPESWRERIKLVIRQYKAEERRQLGFPF